ncbi:MAG TPA: glycosyltransferase family 4 protein [Streptosporangiaceae bacterium]|nr:glycosyltransferase family 4 protein [Streptosporangiaceae bacterium]
MPELRVAVVLSTATGGTALHAGMLAEGCRRAGLAVLALGPSGTRDAVTRAAARVPAAEPRAAGPGTGAEAGAAESGSPGSSSLITARSGAGEAGQRAGRVAGSRDEARGGEGIPFHVVDISDRPRPARDAQAVLRLRRLLRRARPDVVHAHGLRAGALAAAALAAWRSGRRPGLVVTVHNAPPQGRAAGLVYGLLERTCAARAGAVLCASADLAARMRQRGAREVSEFDVPAPVAPPPDAGAIRRARADLGPAGRPVLLTVARLAGQKGLDVLLAAAGQWQQRVPVPLLAIAGEGPLAGELAATARRAGVELTLLGQREDIPALLAAADVVVVPSRWEARALVVQEAMRAGRPVVASRVGGIPDLTGPDAALLVPPEDAAELAAAVSSVLDDAGLATRLATAARARAAALPTLADAVAAVLALYQDQGPAGRISRRPGADSSGSSR